MKALLDMNIPFKYEAMLTKRGVETVRSEFKAKIKTPGRGVVVS